MKDMDFGEGTVLLTVKEHVATVTLNRPDVLNAMNSQMMNGIVEVFDYLDSDSRTWCVILRGGGRAFCVGADQRERAGMSEGDIRRRRRTAPLVFSAARRCSKPVVAQVHGHSLGGGFEIVLGCDLIVVAEEAKMGLVETSRGAIPGGGGTKILPLLVGPLVARELILTGRIISGLEAGPMGLANRVVPARELEATVRELVGQVTNCSPVANAQAKKAMYLVADLSYDDSLRVEAEMYERVLTSPDRQEALAAFREKRPPHFGGN